MRALGMDSRRSDTTIMRGVSLKGEVYQFKRTFFACPWYPNLVSICKSFIRSLDDGEIRDMFACGVVTEIRIHIVRFFKY